MSRRANVRRRRAARALEKYRRNASPSPGRGAARAPAAPQREPRAERERPERPQRRLAPRARDAAPRGRLRAREDSPVEAPDEEDLPEEVLDEEVEDEGADPRIVAALREALADAQADAPVEGWGAPLELGGTMRVRARPGFRVAAVEIRPGMHVVAEIPKRTTELGIFPLAMVVPAAAKAVSKALKRKDTDPPPPKKRPDPSAPAPRWLDKEDLDELGIDIGAAEIAACQCQRRRR